MILHVEDRSDCRDAQADLSHLSAHMSERYVFSRCGSNTRLFRNVQEILYL